MRATETLQQATDTRKNNGQATTAEEVNRTTAQFYSTQATHKKNNIHSKVALIDIPIPTGASQRGCVPRSSCICTTVSIPTITSQGPSLDRQKLMQMISELEVQYNREILSMKEQHQRELLEALNRISALQLKLQSMSETNHMHASRQQQLMQRIKALQTQKDNILRNKVAYIEANLSEKNMDLENTIACLKEHHQADLQELKKQFSTKSKNLETTIKQAEAQKAALEQRIRGMEIELRNLGEGINVEVSQKMTQITRRQELQREISRLRVELELKGTSREGEMLLMRERVEQLKQRVKELEESSRKLQKEKDQIIGTAAGLKAEIEIKNSLLREKEQTTKSILEDHQRTVSRMQIDLETKLKNCEEQWHRRLREAEAQYSSKLQSLRAEAKQKQAAYMEMQTKTLESLKEEWAQKIKAQQDEWAERYNTLDQQWRLKMEEELQQLRKSVVPPQPAKLEKEYVYIEKLIESPQLKILKEKLLVMTTNQLSLEGKIAQQQLERTKLDSRLNYLNGLEATFNKEREKWLLEREELLRRLTEKESMQTENMTWVVEKIIKEQNGKRYVVGCDPDLRVVESVSPGISYRVVSSRGMEQVIQEEGLGRFGQKS